MKELKLVIYFICLFTSVFNAQSVIGNSHNLSHLHEHNKCGVNTSPLSDSLVRIIEKSNTGEKAATFTVSVVVHDYSSTSDLAISQMIDQLNANFALAVAGGGGDDTDIHFCIAKTDPSGNPSTGILHSTGGSSFNFAGITASPTPGSQAMWDPEKYLNIWIVDNLSSGNGVASLPWGYAFGATSQALSNSNAPYQAQNTVANIVAQYGKDGVIIEAGTINVSDNYVVTHEAGHYLGLPHTFRNLDGLCEDGDGLSCTGNSPHVSPTNCSSPSGCSGMDMQNFMVYRSCSPYRYRVCQKDVMRYVLNNQRSDLKNNGKCDAAYDLSIDNATITKNNCDLTFDASIVISRNGTQNLTGAILRYRINGGAFVNIPWPGNLNNSNPSRTINLTGLSGVNGANTFYVELRNVNNNLNSSKKDQEINNDTQTKTFTMNQPAAVTVSASSSAICAGESVNLSASGSSSYSWNQSLGTGATKNDSPSNTKNYIVTGTTSGCSTTASVQVIVNNKPTAFIASVVNETCQNENGSFTINSSGGQSPYEYSLNNGPYITGNNVTGVGAGLNSIKVKDANGCLSSDVSITITNTGGYPSSITADSEICLGDTKTLNLIVPVSGVTYTWNNGLGAATQHIVSPTSTTTYNVVVTDGTCVKNETTTVTVNPLPSVSANASSVSICAGDNLTLTGSGASTYVWDNSVSDGIAFVPNTTKTYTVTGTDGNSCVKTSNITVTVNTLPTIVANANSSSICIGDNLVLTGGGASTYVWDNSVSDGVPFSPGSTTTYSVTGTDGNGCIDVGSISVVVNQLPTIVASSTKDSVCVGSNVTLTASGGATYSWNNGVVNGVAFSPTTANTYTVTGTDVNGCVNQDMINLESLPSPTVSMSLSEVTLCKDETVNVSVSGASSYSWVTNDITSNITLTYPESFDSLSVFGIDAIGRCSTYYAIPFNQSNMETTITPGFSLCIGDQASVAVSNLGGIGLEYEWDNGLSNANSHLISPSTPTVYNVVVTDVYGCDDTLSTNIDVIASPNLTLSTNSIVFCPGDSESIIASGADEYLWNTGDTLSTLYLEYPVGVDSIIITGINNGLCYDSKVVSVSESFMVNSLTDSTSICSGDHVEIGVETNDPSVLFTWNNGLPSLNSHNLSPTSTTTYNVDLVDSYGCMESLVTQIVVVPLPQLAITLNEIILCDGDQVDVSVSGADTYNWNTGDTNSVLTISYPTGLDTLKVIGINGGVCISDLSVPVTQSIINATISGNQSICEGGSVSLLVATNNSALDYNWNQGLSNSNFHSVSPTITTNYTVELEDQFGCKDTLSTLVVVDSEPNLSVSPANLILCLGEDAILNASGADQYNWSTGGNDSTETITAISNTSINLVGVNGACSQSLSIPILVNPIPTTIITSDVRSINTGDAIQFYNVGSTANNYQWNFGDATPNSTFANPYHTFNNAGAYIVKLTGYRGVCENTDSILVYVGVVGVNETEDVSIIIFPNPTAGFVNFEISKESSDYEILIYNNIGSLVYKRDDITTFNNQINLSFLSDGVYYLKAISEKESKVFQVQVIH